MESSTQESFIGILKTEEEKQQLKEGIVLGPNGHIKFFSESFNSFLHTSISLIPSSNH